jgi:hypothetical protein
MSLFEAIYGRRCNTPISWDNLVDRELVGPKLLRKMEEKMLKIKKNLKVAQDKKKIYVDKGRTDREFKVGDHDFLKLKSNKISLKLGNCSKLETRYYGLFEILEDWVY